MLADFVHLNTIGFGKWNCIGPFRFLQIHPPNLGCSTIYWVPCTWTHMNPEHDDFQKDMKPLCSCSNNIYLSYLCFFFWGGGVDVLSWIVNNPCSEVIFQNFHSTLRGVSLAKALFLETGELRLVPKSCLLTEPWGDSLTPNCATKPGPKRNHGKSVKYDVVGSEIRRSPPFGWC